MFEWGALRGGVRAVFFTKGIAGALNRTDPTHNKPTRVPLDPVLLNKPMRIIFYYVLPAIFLASLLLNIYQFFTRNYHYETGRYTTVKLGKPKNAATM